MIRKIIDKIKKHNTNKHNALFLAKAKPKARGLTLIEVGLAVAVAAIVIAAGIYFYKSSMSETTAYKASGLIQALFTGCRAAVERDSTDTCATVAADAEVPKGYSVKNKNSEAEITLPKGLNDKACSKVIKNLSELATFSPDDKCTKLTASLISS